MPFQKVSQFDGRKGYIDSVDETEPMRVVSLNGINYLVPSDALITPCAADAEYPVFRIISDSIKGHSAVATDAKNPDTISRLVKKYKHESVAEYASGRGENIYGDMLIDDGSEAFRAVVDAYTAQKYRPRVMKMLAEAVPNEVEYLQDVLTGFLNGMKNAALAAGHQKNAEYISQALERLEKSDVQ